MRARGLAALAVALAAGGCLRPDDPLELDPDAVSIAIVLVAGESEAFMLAGHPHRAPSDPPPVVRVTLLGPGWEAAFSDTTDIEEGCDGGPTFWEMPMICLRAPLPEPIREQTAYGLEGEGPKGRFTGSTITPSAPVILSPADTFELWEPNPYYWAIPIRYATPDDVGTLRAALLAVFTDSSGTHTVWVRIEPWVLDIGKSTDSLAFENSYDPMRQSRGELYLVGIGWHYTDFVSEGPSLPSYGIEGDEVYGYFDGAVKSLPLHVVPPDSASQRSSHRWPGRAATRD